MGTSLKETVVPQHDFYTLSFALQTFSGDAVNISGTVVMLHTWAPGAPSSTLISRSGSITSATGGTCDVILQSGDFQSTGLYAAEIEVTISGQRNSYGPFYMRVQEGP